MEGSSQFDDHLISFDEIFEQENRIFRIPDYQRGYSWETQQRNDLWTDIQYIIKSKFAYRHYTGTIVASFNKDETNMRGGKYEVFDIVDGQQRVTSLVLLLSVLCRKLRESNVEGNNEHAPVFSKFIQFGNEGNTMRKLYLGQNQDKLFRYLVEKGKTPALDEPSDSKSDQNLKDAVDQFEEWLKDDEIDAVLRVVRKQLGFLFYAPENNKEIGIMFEVINNRGKALSELEKIKNYLIYYAVKNSKPEIKDRVNEYWPDILSNLNKVDYTSNESENRFLRNCWIVFMDTHKSKSHNVYGNLKLAWPPDGEQTSQKVKVILKFIEFLKGAAAIYARYLKRYGVTDSQEMKWLERISCHPADASITPLILAVLSIDDLDQNDRNDLLELLEKLNFRFYGTNIAGRADSGQGDLFNFANHFFNFFGKMDENEGRIIDVHWLKDKLVQFIDRRANDKSFIKNLTLDKNEAGDYYHWAGLKFFLASYEEDLKEKVKETISLQQFLAPQNPDALNDFYHKEHIWAVRDTARIDDSEYLDVNKRRLGNFLLLKQGINIAVGKQPPEVKVESYFESSVTAPDTLMIRKLKKFFDDAKDIEQKSENWQRKRNRYWTNVYKRFLDKREEEMVNFALRRWRVSGLNSKITSVQLDSLGDKNEIYTTFPQD